MQRPEPAQRVGGALEHAGRLQPPDHDEERREEDEHAPLDALQGLLDVRADEHEGEPGGADGDDRRAHAERVLQEEENAGRREHQQEQARLPRPPQGIARAQAVGGPRFDGMIGQPPTQSPREECCGRHPRDRDHRERVREEVDEREAGGGRDEDVGRVADERGHAAHVGEHRLGHQQRRGRNAEHPSDDERGRGDDDDRGDVVEKHRQHGGDGAEQQKDEDGPAAGDAAGLQGQVLEEPGRRAGARRRSSCRGAARSS